MTRRRGWSLAVALVAVALAVPATERTFLPRASRRQYDRDGEALGAPDEGIHEGPEAEVDSVGGLGVAVRVGSQRLVYRRRATVGTATEISYQLAALFAGLGERDCPRCAAPMERSQQEWICPNCGERLPLPRPRHFSAETYAAACLHCHGVGTLQSPRPEKLIIHPEKPLGAGAMYSPGFFPIGYLCTPFNGGYYALQALAEHSGFDVFSTP